MNAKCSLELIVLQLSLVCFEGGSVPLSRDDHTETHTAANNISSHPPLCLLLLV